MWKLVLAVAILQASSFCTGLLFPNSNNNNNNGVNSPTSSSWNPLSYQASPETAEYLDNTAVDSNDYYPNFEDTDGNNNYSILDFLRSKSAGTGHIEPDVQSSYYTLDPSLDMLVDWTLDYVDAIDLAGGMTRVSVGVEDMMAPEFVFCSPTIGPISKNDFIKLMSFYRYNGLDLASAIPDLTVSYEGWHQDPHDAWRIWTVARYSGTHTGTATLPGSGLTLTPSRDPSQRKKFVTGPELQSFLWTPSKKLLWQTVGYIGDQNTGSNQGHGSLYGLLVSMGLPPLYLETTEPLRNVQSWFSQFQQSETASKLRSSYSALPQWWHERKTLGRNLRR
ncbi:hypothetical protein IV203_037885 [Nitzschia inconspicua]|uniref:Uncharacterized protein n=1 Tax=Nitzschia inconspicua TaxID=303405 RepID=A0A9K3LMZ7_9STRA|nr:hypothetical protein IV203_037885 [Nitzschia inconspicua]